MAAGIQIVAPTIVRFTMKGLISGAHAADNIIDISLDEFGETRSSAIDTMNPHIVQAWQDNIVNRLGNSYTFTGAHFIDLDSLSGHRGEIAPQAGHPTVGGDGSAQSPPNVCYLVHKNCSASRRQRSGRMYLPCVPEPAVDSAGNVLSSTATAWNGWLAGFRTALIAVSDVAGLETVAWRVVHIDKHRASGGPPTDPGTWTWSSSDVDSATIDPKVATIRKRLR